MSDGILFDIKQNTDKPRYQKRSYRAVCSVLIYLSVWGGLCSMAYLSSAGVVPLIIGGLFAALIAVLSENKKAVISIAVTGLIVTAALILARLQSFTDGVGLLLNRLFAASEARQAYTYTKFAVSANAGTAEIRYALVPLGILSGVLCGMAVMFRPLHALIFVSYTLFSAWLGISPSLIWSVLLIPALVLPFFDIGKNGSGTALAPVLCLVLAAAVICSAVIILFPGESDAISAFDENARDYLAMQTMAFTDKEEYETVKNARNASDATKKFYRRDETSADTGDGDIEWIRPLSIVLVILLMLLLLFLPAIFSDRLKKRREINRAGLDDPDCRESIRAMFLYSIRWLRLGGLSDLNRPYSAYADEIGEIFSQELRTSFETVLPLWQEAAYSGHEMDQSQKDQMKKFMDCAHRTVWDGLGKKQRLLANYYYAL